ncbi:hypothetical protein BGZ52_006291 [Haplosporangium bisporale]|nr:hypothetical protein BGZ52_006291 [Haplosporangium bisporale]
MDSHQAVAPFFRTLESCYFNMIAGTEPKATIRLVFQALQIPLTLAYATKMTPLANKHQIEIFMIPNEYETLGPDSDIILGFGGAHTRVYPAVQEFIEGLSPARRGFYVWTVCILIPPDIKLGHNKHTSPTSTQKNKFWQSSVPELQSVLGHCHGPVYGNVKRDDHLFSLQSTSLNNIMAAIRFVGQAIIQNEIDSGPEMGDGFYIGGTPSKIPECLSAHAKLFSDAAARYEQGFPVGYMLRPQLPRSWMLLRTFHLQLRLTSAQAVYLMQRANMKISRLMQLQKNQGHAVILISHDRYSPERICDIGGNNYGDIVRTVGALVTMLQDMSVPGMLPSLVRRDGEIYVIVPQRVAEVLGSSVAQVVVEKDVRGQWLPVRPPTEGRLEPRETEFTAVVKSTGSAKSIEDGIRAILLLMYKRE